MVIFRVVLPVGSSWAREPCHWAIRMCRHHMGTRVPVLGALGGSQGCRNPMSLCSRLWDSPQGCRDPVFLCSGALGWSSGGSGSPCPQYIFLTIFCVAPTTESTCRASEAVIIKGHRGQQGEVRSQTLAANHSGRESPNKQVTENLQSLLSGVIEAPRDGGAGEREP